MIGHIRYGGVCSYVDSVCWAAMVPGMAGVLSEVLDGGYDTGKPVFELLVAEVCVTNLPHSVQGGYNPLSLIQCNGS